MAAKKILFLDTEPWLFEAYFEKNEALNDENGKPRFEADVREGTASVCDAHLQQYAAIVTTDGYLAAPLGLEENYTCDDLPNAKRFLSRLAAYAEAGGLVVIFASEGVFEVPRLLGPHFGTEWVFAAYSAEKFALTEAGERMFSGRVLQEATPCYHEKHNMLSTPEGEGMFHIKHFEKDFDVEFEREEDPNWTLPRPTKRTPVAVHRCGNNLGAIAYFSCSNWDTVLFGMFAELCTRKALM
ncbi:unnamed protein product [Amoebophrya sp. A120]|nr:unnamed protein product [Amoebophrya sp. A120]|eukprot:GSA120T00003347001.1